MFGYIKTYRCFNLPDFFQRFQKLQFYVSKAYDKKVIDYF